jgi:hypothetical protein
MFRTAALLVSFALVGACTVIKINAGDSQTIEHEAGPDVARDLTSRACRKAGQASAEIISSVNKDASRPPGTGRQVTTFRCSSSPPSPAQP